MKDYGPKSSYSRKQEKIEKELKPSKPRSNWWPQLQCGVMGHNPITGAYFTSCSRCKAVLVDERFYKSLKFLMRVGNPDERRELR